MPAPLRVAIDQLLGAAPRELPPSAWLRIDQERVDRFADVTEDRQWIHVDPEAARRSPFGGTIAHGYLTLSLLPRLLADVLAIDGAAAVINYGLDRLRFPSPVATGNDVRLTGKLANAERRGDGILYRLDIQIELRDKEKPALVAEALFLAVPRGHR